MEAICGLLKLTGGSISFDGKVCKEKQRCKLSYMVFQDVDYQLFSDSVENECRYGLPRKSQDETIHRKWNA